MLALNLIALPLFACARPADELLPETPAGWRYERLELPLDFAPDLEHTGFEELRFAPGMFAPGSPTYFSYVFAIRIEEDLRADERFLQHFLERYYGGLCSAVAESRGLDVDLAELSVEVRFDGRDHVATVGMFDVFGAADPLTLRVELSVHAGARYTELLGLASPLERDADVWGELESVRERWRDARSAAAFLNHLYVVPDAQTYAALVESQLLAQLAVHETRTTVRADLTYTGLYFYCDSTYFEFLAPSEAFPAGSTGVAFGFEEPGAAAAAARRLGEGGVGAGVVSITRAHGNEQVPWFEMLGIAAAPASHLSLFALEYDPRFLASWYSDSPPGCGGIARRSVLARYAAQLGQQELRRSAQLVDVTAVHLALDQAAREHLAAVAAMLGYVTETEGDTTVHDGPGVTLVVRAAAHSRGVTGFELALGEPVEREPLELGSARLTFEGATARLEFRP